MSQPHFVAGLMLVLVAAITATDSNQTYPFMIGTGIADITGPAAEIGFMGYVQFKQTGYGIHYRQYARAFIIQDGNTMLTFVNLDLCFTTSSIKIGVLNKLEKLYPGLFAHENLMISSTHTHSAPGGFSWNTLYQLTTFGVSHQNIDGIIDGIVMSIQRAKSKMVKGDIMVNQGELIDPLSNINRSPSAYANNPPEERAKYKYNVDKLMVSLRFEGENGPIGALNWFAVHGTSMNNTNRFISGDNKGYAAMQFEAKMNMGGLPGKGPFVAVFGQSNEGDVSPNTRGGLCPDGTPCSYNESTCGGWAEGCKAVGPGKDMFDSTRIIGQNQFDFAYNLFNTAKVKLAAGNTSAVHAFVDFFNVTVSPKYSGLGVSASTCPAAIGDATAAGTIDGAGDFDFHQGTNSSNVNPIWNMIGRFLHKPSKEVMQCHYPKPILVFVGGVRVPTPMVPNILPLQLFRIGHLFIIAVPAEFTTMSGRRLRNTVRETLIANGAPSNTIVVIAGLANEYTQYVATPEEYQVQRYEGSSTLFGPMTLPAYQQEFAALAQRLMQHTPAPTYPQQIDYSDSVYQFQPGVWFDGGPAGSIVKGMDVKSSYSVGQIATVEFFSGDPRNNLRHDDTFLTVERQEGNAWVVIATDGNWETKFTWKRHFGFPDIAESYALIQWDIPAGTEPGVYRIRHFGDSKHAFSGKITQFVGTSSSFKVTA